MACLRFQAAYSDVRMESLYSLYNCPFHVTLLPTLRPIYPAYPAPYPTPQMNGVACQMVVDEFKRAVDEVRSNPASLGLWQTIIGKYSPTFLTACSDAIKWSEELAERWLTEVNPQINMNKVKNVFINHNHSYSHSRHISKEDCRAAGLPKQI